MSLKIQALQGAGKNGKLNEEWIVVANEGDTPFNADGCSITAAKGSARPRIVAPLPAGVIFQPKEICRLITGGSGKKSHGEAPEEEKIRNVFLFQKATYLDRPGTVVRLMNRQREICKTTYQPDSPAGMAT